jgi:hypothetical protein
MGDALASAINFGSTLFSTAAEAAPAIGGAAGAGAGAGADLGALIGTGEGLFGGSTGLGGTLLAGGVPAADIASGAALGTAGLGSLGTAADFLAAPGAGAAGAGFGTAANTAASTAAGSGLASGLPSAGTATLPGTVTPSVASFTPTLAGSAGISPAATPTPTSGVSVFDTGTKAVPGLSGTAGATGIGSATPQAATSAAGLTPAAAATAAPADATSTGSFWDKLLGGATKSVTNNPLGIALGAGGLGYDIFKGNQASQAQQQMQQLAAQQQGTNANLVGEGQNLVNPLMTGNLPPMYQAQITQAVNDAKTRAISNAAAQGMPTDPTKNSVLAQELSSIDAQVPQMTAQVAQQLAQTGTGLISAGTGAAGISSQLYGQLASMDQTQSANTAKAIAALAQSFNTGGGGKSGTAIPGTNLTVSASP